MTAGRLAHSVDLLDVCDLDPSDQAADHGAIREVHANDSLTSLFDGAA
jgi:hypothetical protein